MGAVIRFVRRAVSAVITWFDWRPAIAGNVAIAQISDDAVPDVLPLPSHTLSETMPAVAAEPRRLKRGDPHEAENGHFVWQFRADILDDLDSYRAIFSRLKRHDLSAYRLFSRTGLSIPPGWVINADHADQQAKLASCERPAIGGILLVKPKPDGMAHPSLVYFRKLAMPTSVQWADGDVYQVTALYEGGRKSGPVDLTVPIHCHIALGRDGSVILLKERVVSRRVVQPRTRSGRKLESFVKTEAAWAYPAWIWHVLSDKKNETPQDWARWMFTTALITYVHTLPTDRLIVRAKRDDVVAAFAIDRNRGRYFFKDRSAKALAADGKRKRIFHYVQPHQREVRADATVSVRAHYRGLRKFEWNGYQVSIILPKNNFVREFPVPSQYLEDIPTSQRRGLISEGGLGARLAAIAEE